MPTPTSSSLDTFHYTVKLSCLLLPASCLPTRTRRTFTWRPWGFATPSSTRFHQPNLPLTKVPAVLSSLPTPLGLWSAGPVNLTTLKRSTFVGRGHVCKSICGYTKLQAFAVTCSRPSESLISPFPCKLVLWSRSLETQYSASQSSPRLLKHERGKCQVPLKTGLRYPPKRARKPLPLNCLQRHLRSLVLQHHNPWIPRTSS